MCLVQSGSKLSYGRLPITRPQVGNPNRNPGMCFEDSLFRRYPDPECPLSGLNRANDITSVPYKSSPEAGPDPTGVERVRWHEQKRPFI